MISLLATLPFYRRLEFGVRPLCWCWSKLQHPKRHSYNEDTLASPKREHGPDGLEDDEEVQIKGLVFDIIRSYAVAVDRVYIG